MIRIRRNASPTEAVAELKKLKAPGARAMAVYTAGAMGRLDALLEELHATDSPEARAAAVFALRHYAGVSAANDVKVYEALKRQKYSPGQAGIAMYLLHGIGPAEQKEPDTFDALIRYLDHSQLGIRELAAWHLGRLAPEGQKIAFDAAAPAEERARGQKAWRVLIPAGKLPQPR